MLQYVGKLLGSDGYRPLHEFWDVIAFQELTMIVGVGTGQFKRLAAMPIAIDMGNEWARVVAVVASATEDDPPSVARPGVVAFGVG